MRHFTWFVLVFLNVHLSAQDRSLLKNEVDKIIYHETEITLDKTPGFIVGLLIGDSTYVFPYGHAARNTDQVLSPENIFELGGITKVFTANVIEILVSNNQLNYEDLLNDFLPEEFQNQNAKELNILQLVTHTSGLPRMPAEFGIKEIEDNNPYKYYSKNDLLQFYANFFWINDGSYLYSNVNYALLEIVIEKVTGSTYEEVVQDLILSPLEMDNSFYNFDGQNNYSKITKGYSITQKAVQPWMYKSFSASEGLKSNMNDLVKFVRKNLTASELKDDYSMAPLLTKNVVTPLNEKIYSGKGWHTVVQRNTPDIHIHSGTTAGHRSFIGFVKSSQTAVIVLSNSEYTQNGLGFHLLRLINGNWKKKKKSKK